MHINAVASLYVRQCRATTFRGISDATHHLISDLLCELMLQCGTLSFFFHTHRHVHFPMEIGWRVITKKTIRISLQTTAPKVNRCARMWCVIESAHWFLLLNAIQWNFSSIRKRCARNSIRMVMQHFSAASFHVAGLKNQKKKKRNPTCIAFPFTSHWRRVPLFNWHFHLSNIWLKFRWIAIFCLHPA